MAAPAEDVTEMKNEVVAEPVSVTVAETPEEETKVMDSVEEEDEAKALGSIMDDVEEEEETKEMGSVEEALEEEDEVKALGTIVDNAEEVAPVVEETFGIAPLTEDTIVEAVEVEFTMEEENEQTTKKNPRQESLRIEDLIDFSKIESATDNLPEDEYYYEAANITDELNEPTMEMVNEEEDEEALAAQDYRPQIQAMYDEDAANDPSRKHLAGTNMEMYGTAEHRTLKQIIASKEKAWEHAGQLHRKRAGSYLHNQQKVEVWRIEKFKVVKWPKERYGEFFRGDSYIILNTYTTPGGKVLYNVHFWLGKETSQDEAGAAAMKTVELDDFLGDLPVQYREVDGYENKEFTDLFPEMTILDGGVESGFNIVEPETYEPRLLHISDNHGKLKKMDQVRIDEIPLVVTSLNDHDSFLLDAGTVIYCFHSPFCSFREKFKSGQVMNHLSHARHGRVKNTYTIDWHDRTNISYVADFWNHFGGKPENLLHQTQEEMDWEKENTAHEKALFHVSDETGEMIIDEIARGEDVSRDQLLSEDCFILDTGVVLFVWVGAGANKNELREAMGHAVNFLHETGRPAHTPIIRIIEGKEPHRFWKAFDSKA